MCYFILFIYFFFHDIRFTPSAYSLCCVLNLIKIVQISQNAIWSNNTYAVVAHLVWVVSPGVRVCVGGGGGGGAGQRV